jgi:hypothetical protein
MIAVQHRRRLAWAKTSLANMLNPAPAPLRQGFILARIAWPEQRHSAVACAGSISTSKALTAIVAPWLDIFIRTAAQRPSA